MSAGKECKCYTLEMDTSVVVKIQTTGIESFVTIISEELLHFSAYTTVALALDQYSEIAFFLNSSLGALIESCSMKFSMCIRRQSQHSLGTKPKMSG